MCARRGWTGEATGIGVYTRSLLGELQTIDFNADAVAPLVERTFPADGVVVREALDYVSQTLVPSLDRTIDEIGNLLRGLDGRYVPAGPSGAPTRGQANALPTGRNFYSVDPNTIPSTNAWTTVSSLARGRAGGATDQSTSSTPH